MTRPNFDQPFEPWIVVAVYVSVTGNAKEGVEALVRSGIVPGHLIGEVQIDDFEVLEIHAS